MSTPTDPQVPSKTPNNNAGEHPDLTDIPALLEWETSRSGDSTIISHDPNSKVMIKTKTHSNGGNTTEIIDKDGHHTQIHHGSTKHLDDSHTKTTTGHTQTATGGGTRETHSTGHKRSVGAGSSYDSVDGPSVEAMSQNKKSLSEGGNGHHAMEGDQTFHVESGGIHYDVSKDFTVTATGDAIHLDSSNEFSVKVGGNEGHTVAKEFTLDATVKITLKCGSSTIVMEPGHITITSPRIDLNP